MAVGFIFLFIGLVLLLNNNSRSDTFVISKGNGKFVSRKEFLIGSIIFAVILFTPIIVGSLYLIHQTNKMTEDVLKSHEDQQQKIKEETQKFRQNLDDLLDRNQHSLDKIIQTLDSDLEEISKRK